MNLLSSTLSRIFSSVRARLTRPQYIILIAVITGFSSGLMAVLLKSAVHFLQQFLYSLGWYYMLFPVLGLLLTVGLVQLFWKNSFEKGIAMALRAIAKKASYIPTSNTYKHVVTSALTVGFGGSAGLEAPIVATGSSFGSLFGRITDLNYQERTLMLACGAAAGIAAVFNAPIAGVIFAVEILLAETLVSYFIPLMIASVTGVLCSKILLNESALFNFILEKEFDYRNVPYYIILGILAGFISLYYAKVFKFVERKIHYFRLPAYAKALMAGASLILLVYFFPPLFGEGYKSVAHLANANTDNLITNNIFNLSGNTVVLLVFLGSVMLLKPVAVAVTLGAGGNGGNFAPSLFTGAFLGFFFSRMVNATGLGMIPEGNFSLVAMAGLLSGVMYCPLTAMFLIAEITNGYGLFIPLMIVSALSFFIVKHFEPYSMETKKLAEEGEIFTHQKEKNILTTITIDSILSDEYSRINIQKKLVDLVELIKTSDKNIFAVEDEKGVFCGIIELNDIKILLFDKARHEQVTVRQIMKKPRAMIDIHEPMTTVMEKMDNAQSWYLPVVSREKKFISFISKTKLFSRYREILGAQSDIYEIKGN